MSIAESNLKELIKSQAFSKPYTIAAGVEQHIQIPVKIPDGYSLLGVTCFYTGSAWIMPFDVSFTAVDNVTVSVRNAWTAQLSGTAGVRCLFIKNV